MRWPMDVPGITRWKGTPDEAEDATCPGEKQLGTCTERGKVDTATETKKARQRIRERGREKRRDGCKKTAEGGATRGPTQKVQTCTSYFVV